MDDNNVFTLNKIIRYLKELDADIICLQEVLYNQFALLKQSLKVDGDVYKRQKKQKVEVHI